jgi:natural product biosynthesis luciferase-like monooxygenase protein/FkbM family methyltransferase
MHHESRGFGFPGGLALDHLLRTGSGTWTSLVHLLRGRAEVRPERLAYTFLKNGEAEDGEIRVGDLDARARALGAALQELGGAGERVLLLFPPGLDFIAGFFGCLYAGAVAVPAYPPSLSRAQPRLRAIARDARPAVVLAPGHLAVKREAIVAQVPELAAARWLDADAVESACADRWREVSPGPDTLAFLQYTSGSTADPKGVMVSHGNLLHNEEMIRRAFDQSEQSVIVGWLPLYHDMGLIGNVLQPLWVDAPCILMSPASFLQRPVRWLRAISRYRGTTSGGPNFAYDLCVRKISPEEREGLDLSSWEVAFNGAEPVRAATLDRFAEAFAPSGFRREAFYPCYGLAEGTLFVSGGATGRASPVAPAPDSGRPLVGCGHAWLDQRIAIVEPKPEPESGIELPPGQVGEIWVAGPSVAGGYWERDEETRRTFQARLAGNPAGPSFLRTGDLGFLADGELFISGRLKDLIILRGRNLYPQDVELTAEQSHPALRPGCAAAFDVEMEGDQRLVLVSELERGSTASAEEVAAAVRRAVAQEHEAQVHEVVLIRVGTLPKTSSGKIRRRACREGYLAGTLEVLGRSGAVPGGGDDAPFDSGPGSEITRESLAALPPDERQVAVQEWLARRAARRGLPAPRPDRPLVESGLDSLAAVELQHAAESGLGARIPVAALLGGATLAGLALLVVEQWREHHAAPDEAPPRSTGPSGDFPLSHGQRALWFLERLAPESALYNLAAAARVRGPLDPAALERALGALAARHPVLRTTFATPDGQPRQRVRSGQEPGFANAFDVAREDATSWSEEQVREALDREASRTFALEDAPPWRARLLTRGPEEHLLLLVFHHLIADFWTIAGLLGELEILYRREIGDPAPELPPLPATYADFAAWQEEMLAGPRGERLWAYWQRRLAGPLPQLELPADRPRPPVQSYRGGAEPFALDADATAGLRAVARESGATLFMTLAALFQTLLHRSSGQEDLLIGTPTSGRGPRRFARVAGYFVNPVALRADLSGAPGFAGLLARLRADALAAYEHQDYPFALLAERLQPQRDPSRSPVFQVLFIFQKSHLPELDRLAGFSLGEDGHRMDWAGLELEAVRLGWRPAPFDLTLSLAEVSGSGDEIAGSLQFNADLFDAVTARRLLDHLAVLALSAAAEPERPVAELPLLTPGERQQLLGVWNDTAAGLPDDLLVHRLIESQMERTPDAIAVDDGRESLTYRELHQRADRLADHLQSLGLTVEDRVGICLDRSADMVVGLLGILRSGGAYVPLDPAYPRDRLGYIVEDAGVDLLVTRRRLAGMFATTGVRPVLLDERLGQTTGARVSRPEAAPGSLAYLIYTSGSTGRPKGVMVEHREVVSFFAAMDRCLGTQAGCWVAATSISFDISVLELLWTLTRGFKVVLHRGDGALPAAAAPRRLVGSGRPIDFSLFYFASDERRAAGRDRYRLLLDGARIADRLGFAAVWTPERHFHAFGGLYPNPSVTSAAVAAVTERIAIRAGSVVLPLHDPIRVAEEWSVVDNLSDGRVGLSFASGWNAADFVFAPEDFARRKEVLREQIDTVRRLWRGEAVRRQGGAGEVEVRILPRPVQPELPVWLTAAASLDTFRLAGEMGTHVLTHLLGQSARELEEKIAAYRQAWRAAGHDREGGEGQVALMLHTFVGDDPGRVRETVRGPFTEYLASSLDLMKVLAPGQDLQGFTDEDRRALLDRAFDRYFETSGLFGTPESCLARVDELRHIGVDEIACLVDFGIDTETVLASLDRLATLRDLCRSTAAPEGVADVPVESIPALIVRHRATHLQVTPSAATAVLLDPEGPAALAGLETLLVGGEALPVALAERLTGVLRGELLNMYGPTETTIWSAVDRIEGPVTIGRPIANTELHVLDSRLELAPVGRPGELFIGGLGVVRGYHGRPDLTAERFLPDPWGPRAGGRLYRTGDLVRRLPDGRIAFLGRVDHQVKVRGHRIELGEIETVLAAHPAVREAVVVACEELPGDLASQRLVAYLIPAEGAPFDGTAELAARATPERIDRVFDGHERTVLPNGLPVAHLGAEQTGGIYREIFDQEIYLRHGISLPDGAHILDVGANVGLFTLWAGTRARNARVWSFEPIAPTFRVLRANAELYGLDARVFEIGLSDREEEVDFTFYPRMAGLSGRFAEEDREVTRGIIERWLRDAKGRGPGLPDGAEIEGVVDEFLRSETRRCRLRPLSAVIREEGIERIDLLKVDVEKSEREVMAGIADEDWPKIRQIVLEIHTRELLAELSALLAARGYQVAVDDFIPVGEGVDMVYMLYARRPEAVDETAAKAGHAALSVPDLREWAGRQLPAFMVPSVFVVLPAFPLTPNGKVDRKALPSPQEQRLDADRAYVAPEGETQRAVARVWSELLRLDRIGIHDNFFEIGGNSLLLVEAHGRLRQAVRREVTLVELMRYPTIESLSRFLGQEGGDGGGERARHEKAQDRGRSQRAGLERLARGRQRPPRPGSGAGEGA